MTCIKCHSRLSVIDSRELTIGLVKRWRKCLKCGHTKHTLELSEKAVRLILAEEPRLRDLIKRKLQLGHGTA